jgi:hypothetical protein
MYVKRLRRPQNDLLSSFCPYTHDPQVVPSRLTGCRCHADQCTVSIVCRPCNLAIGADALAIGHGACPYLADINAFPWCVMAAYIAV